ncbi:hypothetical protein KOY48_04880 [Candidatus Minimicrobia naudis]|uniref:Uncharacterized protein n=1 Tax=Candidatus Minimicrobia naudis TaxID=2841263 RepID=A0A8F1SB19_9BACT|nr:hypothetical protein KOY48_04880 [Candidatus Minimicrobia naudis]
MTREVIAEELRAGYTLDGLVIRDAMVKVTRQSSEFTACGCQSKRWHIREIIGCRKMN